MHLRYATCNNFCTLCMRGLCLWGSFSAAGLLHGDIFPSEGKTEIGHLTLKTLSGAHNILPVIRCCICSDLGIYNGVSGGEVRPLAKDWKIRDDKVNCLNVLFVHSAFGIEVYVHYFVFVIVCRQALVLYSKN